MSKDLTEKHIYKSIEAYKHNPNYEKHYERYDFMYEYIKPLIEKKPNLSFFDMGCGDASFIYYLKKMHPEVQYIGMDFSDELIEIINKEPFFEGVNIFNGDVTTVKLDQQFDVVLLSGVISIFDDVNPVLERICEHLVPGGKGFIFSGFNSHDIDVIVRFKNNYVNSEIWESGLNMFSIGTMERILEPYCTRVQAHQFQLEIDIAPSADPIRSFTLTTKEQGIVLLNGANVVRDFYLLEFDKK